MYKWVTSDYFDLLKIQIMSFFNSYTQKTLPLESHSEL